MAATVSWGRTSNGGCRCTVAAHLEAANGCKAVDYRSSRPSHESPRPSGFSWGYEIPISPSKSHLTVRFAATLPEDP